MPTQPRVPWLTPGTAFPVTTTVRDGLYDRIPLGEPETALMATRAFLRMDRVQQLGFVSRVWPGAPSRPPSSGPRTGRRAARQSGPPKRSRADHR